MTTGSLPRGVLAASGPVDGSADGGLAPPEHMAPSTPPGQRWQINLRRRPAG